MDENKRNFLKKGTLLGLVGLVNSIAGKEKFIHLKVATNYLSGTPSFKLPPLPYAFDALEPFIDKQTMEIHYTKHHQAYIDKLNANPSTNLDYRADDISNCKSVDVSTSPLVRNNLGGYFNHGLFWTLLKPNPKTESNLAEGKLSDAIRKDFGTFDNFKKEFSESAAKVFGSGWCWLIVKDGKLKITTTPNQDNPYMKVAAEQGNIVLALDVWEHAYYLKYQNKRTDYIGGWWNIINWKKADELFNTK